MEAPSIQSRLSDVDRLAALVETGLLDSEAVESLDRYVRLVNRAIGAPVALVSLIDDHRQFMSSMVGLPEPFATSRVMPLSHSFCKHVVADEKALVVSDLREHPVLRENLAVRDHGVVAYAGLPIRTDDGHVLGSFCAVDDQPRQWSERDLAILEDLAAAVSAEMNLRRRATRAERSEKRVAEASERLRTLGETGSKQAMAVLHDIRTPLSVLSLGMATLSTHEVARENPELARLLEVLDRNVGHARSLASTMMLEAKRPSPSRADPVQVVREVREDLAPASGVLLTARLAPEGTELAIDAFELRRCVENLVTNALRFAKTQVMVSVELSAERATVRVEDDGPGLASAEQYDAAWDPTVRFHDRTGQSGTGLGLAVVREVIERENGGVSAGPSPAGGASFVFWLPTRAPH